jgi:hypothetical protein
MESLLDLTLLEYARERTAAAPRILSLEEVQAMLAQIEGSMAETIIAERGDY